MENGILPRKCTKGAKNFNYEPWMGGNSPGFSAATEEGNFFKIEIVLRLAFGHPGRDISWIERSEIAQDVRSDRMLATK